MATTRSVRVRIAGLVQGVNFRAWTKRRADELGVSGWVRNLPSGEVEALFSGPAENVDSMLTACWEGPRLARAEKVEIIAEAEPVSGGFTVRF
jgi:acylphosphatase